MIKASDLKKGDVRDLDGGPHVVETFFAQKPGARGAGTLYKVRLRGLATKHKIDRVFRGDDVLQEEEFERRPVQVLYGDAEGITFMDLGDYSQFTWTKDDLENEWPYLTEGMEGLQALVSGGLVIALGDPARVADRRDAAVREGRLGHGTRQAGRHVHRPGRPGPVYGRRRDDPHQRLGDFGLL